MVFNFRLDYNELVETYQLIRKIFLTLSVIIGVILSFAMLMEEPGFYIGAVAYLVGVPFGVYIIFEVISKLMQSVKKDRKNLKVFSEKKYLEAFSEVEENNIQNKELWAKAFAQCDGDIEKQKSIYVELRTKELSKR